ncbi:DNA-dependent ATPase protein rad54 [Linnemannia zychae]|nr:DNA-dependent ATPase protein rad54 [Linnemannia zychae]
MKRMSSGISLKRPAIKLTASQDSQDDTIGSQGSSNSSQQKFSSSPSTETGATKTRNQACDHVYVEIPCVQATQVLMPKTILKKFPGVKSPNQKKVEFVEDSEGSLSDPDDDDYDFEQDKENRNESTVPEISINHSPPTPESKPMPTVTSPVKKLLSTTSTPSLLKSLDTNVPKTMSPVAKPTTITTTKSITVSTPKPITQSTTKKALVVPDPDDEDEDMYNDDGDENSGSDYDSDGFKRKRLKTGRTTQAMIKASLPQPTTRATRSGRAPLSTIKITISSKQLPTTKPIQPTSKSLSTLGKRFKIPTFTDPSKMPMQPHSSGLTLGTKRRPQVDAKSAHDYTMEGSIILYDPAWAQLDEAQREEEKLLKASQEGSSPADGETIQQVIIPKKEKAKYKSIAEILGITKPKEQPKVHVVVDPVLGRVLRPHQVEGVKFMYKCTTGLTMPNAFGCIMADEMGLGKTLQCITLLWTLLKQSPDFGKGTIEKCIICCPSSLVKNWANEIIKWLGPGKIGVLTCDAKGTKEDTNNAMRQWASARQRMVVNPVLIISYESLRMYAPILAQTPIGLMLCDEGHRLKNSMSQTFIALNELNVQRRVILSGTPIQNDLSEYFSLLNFANPGLLGTTAEFRKNYELPILRGRDSEASEKEQEISNQKLAELSGVVSKFIIRRTNDILSKYLPTKFEHVVFCHLSDFQLNLYKHFINSKSIQRLLRGQGSQPLKAIGLLKKLCNHPDLLDLPDDLEGCDSLLPADYQTKNSKKPLSRGGILVQPEFSGKMLVLARMLAKIKKDTNDKIVLISNYTQTLDIFEKLCRQNQYGVLRLDGTMTISKRQKLVDRFNNPDGHEFVFLLSSKAGGCGLNLIGANRLVLFDPDWNPASDQQALARVWRDGQKKDCFVYRFIATGSIEEKIFQRQSHKQSLSSCVVDEDQDVERHFSQENLRQLFQFNETTECCDTHETFKCKRCVDGRQVEKAPQVSYGDTSTWNHFKGDHDLLKLTDPLLQEEAETNAISFVFQYISH